MVAGVLLGPSLLGLVAPDVQAWIFPKASMPILYAIAQVGLVLYMFIVGLEFDVGVMLTRVRGAIVVSWAGVAVPVVLGGLAAVTLRDHAPLFAATVSEGSGALYLAAAMSITAFPVLARIIHEKGIARTRLGTLTLAAGASDDALAWCLLAVVLSQLEGNLATAAATIGGAAAFAVAMLTIGRRVFAPLGVRVDNGGRLTPPLMVTVLSILMLCAWVTDAIGIHAVFGAFLTGVAMPRGRLVEQLTGQASLLTTTFFVPVFFVYSGLNTRIGLLSSPALWGLALLILIIAIAGKGLACAAAARATGEPWRDALAIGVLMNARGLMELIILNIGLERGVITPTLFTIMAMMALVTTLMASPLFELVYAGAREPAGARPRAA
jgi:Kef-type K+ transport system membrane component KefB